MQVTGAQGATVTLMWNANSEPDIAGYRLLYGNAPHTYTEEIEVGNSTTVTVSNLPGGVVHYFAVKASNTAGFVSLPSNEVASTIPGQTPTPTPTATATSTATATPIPTPVGTPSRYRPQPVSDFEGHQPLDSNARSDR